MIFKTFNSDIDNMSSRWGMFGKSFSDIGNTITTKWKQVTDYVTITNDATISGMVSAWKGTSPVQFLSDDNVVNVLNDYNKALDKGAEATAKFFEAGTGNDFMNGWLKQLKGAPATMDDYKAAVTKAELAQDGLTASMVASKMAALALNVAISIGASIAISALIKLVDNLVHANEKAIEKAEELRDKYNDFKETNASNTKTLNDLKDEFEELSDGVSQYGDNISLTTKQYARYKEIVQQIVNMSPSLAEGYDTENGYIADKNGLLERAIELQEIEYRNELRKITNLDNLKTSMSGYIAEYKEALNGGYVTSEGNIIGTTIDTDFKNSLWQVFNTNNRDNYDGQSMASDIMESLGIKDIDKEIEKYINEYGYWQDSDFWNDYCDKIVSNLDVVTNSLTAEEVGLDDTVFDQNIEKLESYAEQYSDMKDSVKSANESIQKDLGYIAEYADGYPDLSKEQQKFVADYLKGFDISDITSENSMGILEYDEDKMSSVKSQIKKFVEELSHDDSTKQALTDLYAPPSDNETIEEYKNRIDSALEVIRKYCKTNGIEIPVGIEDAEKTSKSLEKSYENTINRFTEKMDARSAKQLRDAKERNDSALLSELEKKFGITDRNILSNFFDTEGINTQEEIDYFNDVTKTAKTATEAIEMYKKASFDTSEHSLSDIFELKTDDNTLTSLGKISEEIDKIQTAAKGLKEAMNTYNETGVISIDQLQSILSYGDEYLKYITDENGNLILNEQAIKNVTQARLEELRAKTLENLFSNLENIDNEATAQAYLKSQVLETAQSYEDLAVAEIQAWQAKMLTKSEKGETDLTVATINEVTEGYIRQANAINNLFNNTNLASVFETTTSAAKSTETALDRIKNKFQELTDVIGSNLNLIKSQISLLETRGSTVGRAYYDELISQSTEKIKVLTEQYNELRKQFLQTDRGTEEWLELNAAILETQNAIIGAKADIEGFQNSIDKLHWDELDKIADVIGNISDEAKSVVDLLNTDDVLDDNGNFTKDAITALAMYGEQLESAQYLISKYSKEIEYLNGEYIKGTITVEEYNEKMQDLNDKQWKSVDAYNAAKKAIIELRKKGIDEEIDALEELYDARKKAWEQEKDQHDWEKTVSENETNINKLKQQIEELQNDNSLAGIKKRKELEDELNDLESDWEDTLYDHVYDERQDQLDKELEDKKKALEKTLDDEEKLVADSIDLVNKNSTTILDNLNRLSREYGIQMSNSLTEPFTHGENALSHYSTMFSEANSAFTDQLNYTAMGIYQLQLDADNAAVSVVNMFNSANGTLLEQLSLVRQSLQEITDKANEAANAVRNAGIATPTTTTTTASNSTSSTNRSLGDMAHDTSGTTLPNAGTWKNVQNDIEKAKKDLETIEKQKKVGLVKNTPNKFTTISKGYASGTKSATKGLHPIYEDGVEIIEKDGCLIYPIGAFDGGEKVFNNEQTQRLWELSQNPDVMEKFRQELLNIKPCIDFKFGNTAPVTKTNQNVNVQQHFDALVKVEGDMTPSVYDQLVNDKRIERLMKDWSMEEAVDSINTRGYKIGRIR